MLPNWRYKRFHVSYVLAWMSAGLLAGLFLGQFLHGRFAWQCVGVAVVILLGAFRSRRLLACVLAVVAGCLVGLTRGGMYMQQLSLLSDRVGAIVTVQGQLSQDPTLQNGSDVWQVQLNTIRISGQNYVGELYATVVSEQSLRRGDSITIKAKAGEGFGSFGLSLYRAELVGFQRERNIFLDIRDAFAAAVRSVMPEPEASLGLGFVIGQKSALPDDLVDQLKIVGLTHIVVASGYNLTILVRFARRLLARKSRYLAFVGSVVLVMLFVAFSGLSPSMNRAAIVTGLSLLAWYYGRKFHPLQLILYVAAASAFLYPVYLWSDLGWLLSFAAFTGVLVVAPIITKCIFPMRDEPPAVAQLVIETLSAELMTLPIIMVAFGYIPVFALLANVLVAPVIPFAMAATFVAGLAGLLSPALSILALPASISIAYVIALVERFSSISWAQILLPVGVSFAALWYGILGMWLTLVWRAKRMDLRASSVVE